MVRQDRRYISYLLRLWQGQSGSERVWRASLESPRTGERRGFASAADLFAFVEQEMLGVAESLVTPDTDKTGGQT